MNSFEQLCINFANESLQQHYNWCIFTKDMETCAAEGIDTVDITFPNLQPTLDLIAKVLSQLDDACAIGSAEDKDYLQGLIQSFGKGEPAFVLDLTQQNTFGIVHYAGTVTYNVKNWIEKNRDSLSPAVKQLFSTSTNPLGASLLELSAVGKAGAAAGGRSSRVVTVGGFFKSQMADLMHVINMTNPHWIRCVKPHIEKKPRMLLGPYTFRQLEFSGILGTVKIRRAGYPVRFPIEKFVLQFNVILPLPPLPPGATKPDVSALRDHAIRMLQKMEYLDKKHAQVGKTIVFIKSDTYHLIEQHKRNAAQAFVCFLQSVGRGYKRRVKLMQLQKTVKLQRIGRGMLSRAASFDLFCDKNQEKIKALRAEREAAQRAKEAEERKRRDAEEQQRKQLQQEMRKWSELLASQQQELLDAEDSARDVIESQYDALCDEINANVKKLRQHFLIERAKERFYKKFQPIAQLFFSLTANLETEEADELLEIRQEAWEELHALKFAEKRESILSEEVALRRSLRLEWQSLVVMFDEALVETQQRVENCKQREELELALCRSREKREQARREHHERCSKTQRSAVEKVLFNALFRRGTQEVAEPSPGRQSSGVRDSLNLNSAPQPREPSPRKVGRGGNRLPIRAVEIGMTVFVPSYSQDGIVKAVMPEVASCYLVELSLSKRSVWLEPSDMLEAARIVHDTLPSTGLTDRGGSVAMAGSSVIEQQRSLQEAASSPKATGNYGAPIESASPSQKKAIFAQWQREELGKEKQSPSQQKSQFSTWQSMASMLED